ncbi:unnamed protein product, partial [Tetraodon nigroviridis]
YGGDMLSGELVSWPGPPSPGQMAARRALRSSRAAGDSAPGPPTPSYLGSSCLLVGLSSRHATAHANALARTGRLIELSFHPS